MPDDTRRRATGRTSSVASLLRVIRFLRKLRSLLCHDGEMPLVYRADHDARIVLAVGSGIITHDDVSRVPDRRLVAA